MFSEKLQNFGNIAYREDLVRHGVLFTMPEEAPRVANKYASFIGNEKKIILADFFKSVGRIHKLDALGVTLLRSDEFDYLSLEFYVFLDLRYLDESGDGTRDTLEDFRKSFKELYKQIPRADLSMHNSAFNTRGEKLIDSTKAFFTELSVGADPFGLYEDDIVKFSPSILEVNGVI